MYADYQLRFKKTCKGTFLGLYMPIFIHRPHAKSAPLYNRIFTNMLCLSIIPGEMISKITICNAPTSLALLAHLTSFLLQTR